MKPRVSHNYRYDIYTNFWAKFIRPNNTMHALSNSTLMAHNVEGYYRTEPVVGRLLNSEFAFGTFHTWVDSCYQDPRVHDTLS